MLGEVREHEKIISGEERRGDKFIIHSQQLKLMIKSQFEHNAKLVRQTIVSPVSSVSACVMERERYI